MTRGVAVVLAGVTGLLAGVLVALSIQAPAVELGRSAGPSVAPSPSPPSPPTARTTPTAPPTGGTTQEVLLAWASGGLPAGFADRVAALARVEAVTVVAAGTLDLVASTAADGRVVERFDAGWRVPLDAFAVDPATYATFVAGADREVVAQLGPGEALLGRTSAELRDVGAGATIETMRGRFEVVGVVDDELIGAAEAVVDVATGAAAGLTAERFVLVAHAGDRAGVEAAIRDAAGETPIRVRGPGETPYLRHGDAVLPQALVKAAFGEFAYRPATGDAREVEQDPAWQERNVVSAEVPILGTVRCHRNIVKQLRGALAEVEARGLGSLVDPDGYAGCHHPRLVGAGGALSRHAWGIAVDLNARDNPTGAASRQDPRLVETFARWGFTWGGFWLVPDGMHVEWVGPPEPSAGKVVD